MLTCSFETEEGNTVPYPMLFDIIRRNHGFVDLRGRPDLVAQIPEVAESEALESLLVDLAKRGSPLFTLGCDLGGASSGETDLRRYIAGGYVQIISADYASTSADDYLRIAKLIAQEVEEASGEFDWELNFVSKAVAFNLDNFNDIAASLWIWFHARAAHPAVAPRSRERMIKAMHAALTTSINIDP